MKLKINLNVYQNKNIWRFQNEIWSNKLWDKEASFYQSQASIPYPLNISNTLYVYNVGINIKTTKIQETGRVQNVCVCVCVCVCVFI